MFQFRFSHALFHFVLLVRGHPVLVIFLFYSVVDIGLFFLEPLKHDNSKLMGRNLRWILVEGFSSSLPETLMIFMSLISSDVLLQNLRWVLVEGFSSFVCNVLYAFQ